MIKSHLGNRRWLTSDFLKVMNRKINVIPIGKSAKVSNGRAEKMMLITTKIMERIRNVFLMMFELNTSCRC